MGSETASYEYRLRLGCVILLAVLLSTVYLLVSMKTGRLAQDVIYDDVGYFIDAARRLNAGSEGGLYEFLRAFVVNPPHSPFSTAFALLGFWVGGLNDVAPYAANGIILILLGCFLVKLFQDESRGACAWIIAAALASPLAYRAIHDFRPDILLGLLTGATAWLFARRLVFGLGSAILPGILLGACLLVKPTFVAHTVAMALFLVMVGGVARVLSVSSHKEGLSFLAQFLLIGAAIALPYYLLNAAHIFRYFWENTRGSEASIWSFAGTVSSLKVLKILLFDREYGWKLLGYHQYLCLSLLLVAVILLVKRRQASKLLFIGLVLGAALLSLFVLVVGRHKNEFFLATFQSIILLLGLFSFSQILSLSGVNRRPRVLVYLFSWAALLIVSTLNVGLKHWPVSEDAKRLDSWNDRLVTMIWNDSQSRLGGAEGASPLRVFFSSAGPVNADSMQWIVLKRRVRIEPFDRHRSGLVEEHLAAAMTAHYVIVPHEGSADYYRWLPSSLIQKAFLDSVLKNPDFRLSGASDNLSRYLVFTNERLLGGVRPAIQTPGQSAGGGPLLERGEPKGELPKMR